MVLIRLLTSYALLSAMVLMASISSPQPRRTVLLETITALNQMGIRLHRTTSTPYTTRYVLQVLDEHNATQNLLAGWGDGLIDPEARDAVASWLREGRFGVKIDWDRYLKHQPQSIRLTFRGNAFTREHKAFQQWLDGGHLGVWLSFGEGDRFRRATLLPIDEHFKEANATIHWRMQGYDLNVTRSHPTDRYDLATVMAGALFSVTRTEANQTSQSVQIDRITCHTDTKKRFEGTADCQIPRVVIRDGDTRLETGRIALDQITHEINDTVASTAHGRVDRLSLAYREDTEEGNMTLSGLSGRLDITLGETIAYHSKTLLGSFSLTSRREGIETLRAEVSGIEHDFSLSDLYNFIPELTAVTQGKPPFSVEGNVTRDEQWYLEEILAHVVHHGARAAIAPLKIASSHLDGGGVQASFAPTELTLQAKLDPNTIDVRRSAAPMMMLGVLHVEGKWVLAKKDFQVLLDALPVKIKMLVMVFVNYEDEQAIFNVKFDKGHLLINGKQVM